MRLYAAILSEDTKVPTTSLLKGWGKAVGDLESMKRYVAEAWLKIVSLQQAQPVVNWQAVFLAPEYFFSNRRDASDRFFNHDTKRVILKGLATLAKQYPKLLIIPGTVLWTKAWADGSANDLARQTKAKARNLTARTVYGTQKGLGWSYSGDMTAANVQIAQNVAYVCLGSQMVKYHKVGNYKEVDGESGNLYFASGSIVGRFSVGGVKYGLEICMDHNQGVLDSTRAALGDVHVQLIVSSFVEATTSSSAPVTLHSSTMGAELIAVNDTGQAGRPGEVTGKIDQVFNPGTKQVRFKSGAGARLASSFKANPVKAGPLTVWVIDIDEAKTGITNVTNYTIRDTALQSVKASYLV